MVHDLIFFSNTMATVLKKHRCFAFSYCFGPQLVGIWFLLFFLCMSWPAINYERVLCLDACKMHAIARTGGISEIVTAMVSPAMDLHQWQCGFWSLEKCYKIQTHWARFKQRWTMFRQTFQCSHSDPALNPEPSASAAGSENDDGDDGQQRCKQEAKATHWNRWLIIGNILIQVVGAQNLLFKN